MRGWTIKASDFGWTGRWRGCGGGGQANRHFCHAQYKIRPPISSFEFQRHGMGTAEFCAELDRFFGQVPKDFRYAVEIRNAGLLGPEYHRVLDAHRIAHVYNHWSYMPSLAEQHERMGSFTAPFTVLRLLTPLKMSYEAAKKRAEPYTKIVEELPHMRRDTVVLVRKAVSEQRRAYVLVNNRSEGNAPLTVQALKSSLMAE